MTSQTEHICTCIDMGRFTAQCNRCALDAQIQALTVFGEAVTEAFRIIERACQEFHKPEVVEAARLLARTKGANQ